MHSDRSVQTLISTFRNVTLARLQAVPEPCRDPDLNATNEGAIVVWLR
jgi:hypothetical protein